MKVILKISTDHGYVHAFRLGKDRFLVEAKQREEMSKSSDFFDDSFDVADRMIAKTKLICGERQLPVEPGLRLVHRLTEWIDEHKASAHGCD